MHFPEHIPIVKRYITKMWMHWNHERECSNPWLTAAKLIPHAGPKGWGEEMVIRATNEGKSFAEVVTLREAVTFGRGPQSAWGNNLPRKRKKAKYSDLSLSLPPSLPPSLLLFLGLPIGQPKPKCQGAQLMWECRRVKSRSRGLNGR